MKLNDLGCCKLKGGDFLACLLPCLTAGGKAFNVRVHSGGWGGGVDERK